MNQVTFRTPGEMNLLGYILRSLIERNLKTGAGVRALSRMKGKVNVGASTMKVALHFQGDRVEIGVGWPERADARVQGSMDTLLSVALGQGMVAPVLAGRLKVGGKIWKLLPMLKLLQAEKTT
jgi:ubiquinone biosynthesis protein UbiJ